jgi:hypothetical protein
LTRSQLDVSSVPTSITYKGEVKYIVTDDQGNTHALRVLEMYYCPSIPYRVLSPQSLDKQWRTHRIGTVSEQTSSDGTILYWTNKKGTQYSKTIKHSDRSSVPMFLTKPSISHYQQFRQSDKRDEDINLMAINMSAHYFIDNEPTQAYSTSDPVILQSTDTRNDVAQH